MSVVGLGTWQLGADWGDVSEEAALQVLEAAVADGVTFFDTADVYGDGRSEQVIGRFRTEHPDSPLTVATKMGRRMEQVPDNYTLANFRQWTDRSRRNLQVDTLDLVQLHCPPSAVIDDDATYDALDTLVADGAIAAYGLSVETADQALSAIARPHVASIQIIVNAFRLKPLDEVLPAAAEAGVGVIARVPLASGLLSGKYDSNTQFAADDHRSYNRDGSAFDVGETFSGVDFETGLRAAGEFTELVRDVRSGRSHRCAGRDRLALAAAGHLQRHPGRPQRPAGPVERGRRQRPRARPGLRRRRAPHLRRPPARGDPSPLVTWARGREWLDRRRHLRSASPVRKHRPQLPVRCHRQDRDPQQGRSRPRGTPKRLVVRVGGPRDGGRRPSIGCGQGTITSTLTNESAPGPPLAASKPGPPLWSSLPALPNSRSLPLAAAEQVTAVAAGDHVVAVVPGGRVVTVAGLDLVLAVVAEDGVVAVAGLDVVVAVAAEDQVVTVAGDDPVVAAEAADDVVASEAEDGVGSGGAVQDVRARRSHDQLSRRVAGRVRDGGRPGEGHAARDGSGSDQDGECLRNLHDCSFRSASE